MTTLPTLPTLHDIVELRATAERIGAAGHPLFERMWHIYVSATMKVATTMTAWRYQAVAREAREAEIGRFKNLLDNSASNC